MTTVNGTGSLAAAAVEDDPFFAIVHGDPLLLRADFDDLIGVSWGSVTPGDQAA